MKETRPSKPPRGADTELHSSLGCEVRRRGKGETCHVRFRPSDGTEMMIMAGDDEMILTWIMIDAGIEDAVDQAQVEHAVI